MAVQHLTDRDLLFAHLDRNPYLNLYAIGDLDEFFWPYTTWMGWESDGELRAVALLYAAADPPTLLGLSDDVPAMRTLLAAVAGSLPPRFHAHLTPGVATALETTHAAGSCSEHVKMALAVAPTEIPPADDLLTDSARVPSSLRVVWLNTDDIDELQALYHASYPDNWFDPRMLQTGQYAGVREGGHLVSVAGVHVYSPRYRVAAVGNVATHPHHRNRGLARVAMAALCRPLLGAGMRVGLNVDAANTAARTTYRRLGFRDAAEYGEFFFQRR